MKRVALISAGIGLVLGLSWHGRDHHKDFHFSGKINGEQVEFKEKSHYMSTLTVERADGTVCEHIMMYRCSQPSLGLSGYTTECYNGFPGARNGLSNYLTEIIKKKSRE